MKVVYGRKRIDYKALEADPDFKRLAEPVIALGAGLPEKNVAFVFGDWKEFLRFAARTQAAEQIAGMDERRRKLRKRSGEDTTAIAARLKRRAERIESELRELAEQTRLAWGSKELFIRATTKADPLEGPIFDPSMLFAGLGFTGNALGVTYPGLPDLSWFPGMNNAVSSVQIVGIVALFNNTWFRGASRLLFGFPFFQIPNLGVIGFNNFTSSVLVD
jgi:hypothetical protein